jgi:P4 family phage/plasmid primase-like protien
LNIQWDKTISKKALNPPKGWQKFKAAGTKHFNEDANAVALRTGKEAKLFLVDIDNTEQWNDYLAATNQMEPPTVKARTGSGGIHLYFKWSESIAKIKSTAKVLSLDGVGLDIDTRNDGGMIICPPSSYMRGDNTRASYTWERSILDHELLECPMWLAKAILSNEPTKASSSTKPKPKKRKIDEAGPSDEAVASTSTSEQAQEEESTFPLFKSLENFVFEKCRILPSKLDKLKYFSDSQTFNVQTKEKICFFARREHSSNHQYLVIYKSGKMVQKCHSKGEACNGKELEVGILPEDILKELHGLINLTEPISKEIIELAKKEANDLVNDFFDGNQTMEMTVREDKSIGGTMNKFHTSSKCPTCNHELVAKTGHQGLQVCCSQCTFQFPKSGTFLPVATKYSNLQNYLTNVFIGAVNIYNGPQQELEIGWNQFVDDPITIFQDSVKNKTLLKAMSGTHSRIGDFFVALYKDHVTHCSENSGKPWYVFKQGWKNVEATEIKLLLRSDEFLEYFVKVQSKIQTASGIQNAEPKAKQISAVLMKLETDSYKTSVLRETEGLLKKEDFYQKLDKDRSLLGFKNGVYDLTKGEFRPYLPEDLVTTSVGYDYEPVLMYEDETRIQEINKFMFSVFPDHETCKYVIKFLASCLAGFTDDQLFHFGYGSGSNGKGILIKLMLETLGNYAGTLSASFLTGKTPDADAPTPALTNIVDKRFAATSEIVEAARINEQLFKSLSGQDRLIYRPMRQEAREFEPEFKFFMVANDLPEFKGSDYAMKRRIRVIPFKSCFKDKPDERKGEKKLDKSLNGRVRDWRQAFMGLLLQGYQLYLEEGLEEAPEIKEATKTYQEENNTYGIFLEDCCMKNRESELQVSEVGKRYMEWSREKYGQQSITFKQENKYTPKITEALSMEPWQVAKHELNKYHVYRGLAWK